MNQAFKDHFSSVAGHYARSRPGYPGELFAWLAEVCGARELVWDCGAGTGQASVGLADHFARVWATDASAAQVAQATPHPGIVYRRAEAGASGLETASVDLIVVAQALHWFDLEAFYAEARRVLKPDGVLAVWSYGVLRVEGEAVNEVVQHFYHQEVGAFWPPERRHVEEGYRSLPFPFAAIPAPAFAMTAHWSLEQLLGYFSSWSATAEYRQQRGVDPVARLRPRLLPLWGEAESQRRVDWPLSLRAGRVESGETNGR
ncbi:MAG: class I SAM-dependent methyltransferase [Magnetococcales bacterium]|nr:class I SAM-dependent methyltransferase [Magnetococcales bacterium]